MLRVSRIGDESWRQAVERIAGAYGLQEECLEIFDHMIANGANKDRAAFDALYEWDCCEYVEDKK